MKKIILVMAIALIGNLWAHGDHSSPGAVPPAPHGGTVQEAVHQHGHSHGHDHKEATKREIFFEAILKKDILKVYPLVLDPKTYKIFVTLKTDEFKDVAIKILNPRKNKKYDKTFTKKNDHWEISFSKIKGRRFFISVLAEFSGAKYKGKIQIERKK